MSTVKCPYNNGVRDYNRFGLPTVQLLAENRFVLRQSSIVRLAAELPSLMYLFAATYVSFGLPLPL